VVEGENISILRAEVFDLAGRRIFDSGPVMGISTQALAEG